MEENNRKGSGVFYAVVGVATLVVAIIGATFAYFSAQAVPTTQAIQGGTNDDLANALSVSVEKVTFTGTTAANNLLVPTNVNGDSTTGVAAAVAAKCEANGYTGCHLFKITASSTQTVASVNLKLDTMTTTATVKSDWNYVIYKASADAATDAQGTVNAIVNHGTMNLAAPVDMHAGAAMTANTNYYYYILVYLADDTAEQNKGDANDATGTYAGTISMSALGGKVTATFESQG